MVNLIESLQTQRFEREEKPLPPTTETEKGGSEYGEKEKKTTSYVEDDKSVYRITKWPTTKR